MDNSWTGARTGICWFLSLVLVAPRNFSFWIDFLWTEVVMVGHNVESLIIILGILRQGFPLLPLSVTHANRTAGEQMLWIL